MKTLGIDIVQTFFVEAHLVGGRAAKSAGVKACISSRRNLGYGYGFKEKFLLRLANRFPDRWLANSRAVADRISALEKIDRHKFDVIYNGVQIPEEMSRELIPWELREYDIVMVANLRPVKQIRTLLEAMAEIKLDRPRCRAAVLGDGPLRDELDALARRLMVADNVEFVGSQNDVQSWLQQARTGVLCSSSEGFSNAILEYMTASLPVVASDVGGNPELVQPGKTGLLFTVGDAGSLAERVEYLLSNPQESLQMGRAGRRRIEQEFSHERMVHEYQKYYESLAGK
jgi:glycosyltransferase involved in cell wall biosynthesis